MRFQLAFAIALCAPAYAAATEEGNVIEAALVGAAGLGTNVRTTFSEPSSSAYVLGTVLSEERGKLLLLKRQSSGAYQLEAESTPFDNVFGPRYYIENIRALGPRRFSIQVNAGDGCGIRIEKFHVIRVNAVWRISGYDKDEPQANPCDVNTRSRGYSANLLTHQVAIVRYKNEKVIGRDIRRTKVAAPVLTNFNFSIFETEP